MDYLCSVSQAVLFIVLTWVAIVMTCIMVGAMVTVAGYKMSWFTYTINMVGLFMIPGTVTMISIQEILKHKVFQVRLRQIDTHQSFIAIFQTNINLANETDMYFV